MRSGIRNLVLSGCLLGVLVFAGPAKEWGEGEKQEHGVTMYNRIFQIRASHWEPSGTSSYFADLEFSELIITEAHKGKILYILLDKESGINRAVTVIRNDEKQVREINFAFDKFFYIDLNGDGRFDIFHDNLNEKSYIMTNDGMIPVERKRTLDQDVQRTLEAKQEYRFEAGEWRRQAEEL